MLYIDTVYKYIDAVYLLTKLADYNLYFFTREKYCLLRDNLGIVKYPILDCVVHVCVHVWLGDGSCLLYILFWRGHCHVVCHANPFLLNKIYLNQ